MAPEFDLLQFLDRPERLSEELERRSRTSGKEITRVWKNNSGAAGELMIRRTKGTHPGELCLTLLNPGNTDFILQTTGIAISIRGLSKEQLIEGFDFGRVRDPNGKPNLISVFATPTKWQNMNAVWHRISNANTLWNRIIQADYMEFYQEDPDPN